MGISPISPSFPGPMRLPLTQSLPAVPVPLTIQLPSRKGLCSLSGNIFPKMFSNLALNNLGWRGSTFSPVPCVSAPSWLWSLCSEKRLFMNTGRAILEWLRPPWHKSRAAGFLYSGKAVFCSDRQGKLRAVTVPFLSVISHGDTPAEICRMFVPRGCLTDLSVLYRFMIITETSLSFQNIMQDLSHMSPLEFKESNLMKMTFRVHIFQV